MWAVSRAGFYALEAVANAVVTKKKDFAPQVQAIYDQYSPTLTTSNMRQFFVQANGSRPVSTNAALQAFSRYIVTEDPVTGGPITFLGRPITGGVNVYMLPMLKAAEARILAEGVPWQPAGKNVLGFNFRPMMIGGKPNTQGILSSHSAGLSIDVDPTQNGAKYDGGATNRGNIPDAVVLAIADMGFTWGGLRRPGFLELGDDPMHFQFSLHHDDDRYQSLLKTNATAKKYWDALETKGRLIPMGAK